MPAAKTIARYGLRFPTSLDDLQIEFHMIQQGGQWIEQGKQVGLGLFTHYRNAQKLCWPEDDHHRWSDLILSTILKERIVICVGPKDTGKTSTMSRFGLIDYWCFPETTSVLISSTDIPGLEVRIWGELKSLFTRAKDRFPWLAGYPLDYRHGIFTDKLGDDCDVRDMRKGLVCFQKGTMVDTARGPRRIESIIEGDVVINACGIGTVVQTHVSHFTGHMVRVRLSNGSSLECTPDHPFFTPRGWVKAIDLTICEKVFSADETLCIMQEPSRSGISKSKILWSNLQEPPFAKGLPPLREGVSSRQAKAFTKETLGKILQHKMCIAMGIHQQTICQADLENLSELWKKNASSSQSNILFSSLQKPSRFSKMQGMRENFLLFKALSNTSENHFLQSLLQAEMDNESVRKEQWFDNPIRKNIDRDFPDGDTALCSENWQEDERQKGSRLHFRHRFSRCDAGRGIGWILAQTAWEKTCRLAEDKDTKGTWVVGVTVLQSGSKKRNRNGEETHTVYNLSVTGHPSYSVGGVIVHNCIPCKSKSGEWAGLSSYLGIKQKRRRLLGDELQTMEQEYLSSIEHMDKGDFKMVGAGNPIGMADPLDRMSEPIGGWGTEPESEKTEIWRNKWNGVTINLDGRDTPNNDEPKNRFSYLISQEDVNRTAERRGKDSMDYWMQVIGKRKTGLMMYRVLTPEICRKFNAFDPVVWMGSPITKIFGLDAAYGGDRCVGGVIEFGKSITGTITVNFHEPFIIPVKISMSEPAEDQIAAYVRDFCKRNGVEPEHVFYDATGRGSLGTSFARLWSAAVNPVESGGKATERPVAADIYVTDPKTKQRRQQRCDEAYSKFVTEMWFSVRMLMEANQIRGFPKSVADEFYLREWYPVSGNRKELETKKETKERMGKSPDYADFAAISCEGARRLGLVIAGLENPDVRRANQGWKSDLKQRALKLKESYQLDHAA